MPMPMRKRTFNPSDKRVRQTLMLSELRKIKANLSQDTHLLANETAATEFPSNEDIRHEFLAKLLFDDHDIQEVQVFNARTGEIELYSYNKVIDLNND